jgi:hypothetical protein
MLLTQNPDPFQQVSALLFRHLCGDPKNQAKESLV